MSREHNNKILIVDDEPMNIDILEDALESLDVEILAASNGEDAIELAKTHDFSLILLDIQMPIMNGYEVLQILQFEPKTCHIPVIIVSANATEKNNILRGYEAGAIDYITKPFDLRVINLKVNMFLRLHQLKTRGEIAEQMLSQCEGNGDDMKELTLSSIKSSLETIITQSQAGLSQIGTAEDSVIEAYIENIDDEANYALKML